MVAKNQTPAYSKPCPLDLVLKPLDEAIGLTAAKAVAELELDPEVRARIDQLADMSAAGSLTEAERAEYLEFVEAIDLLSIFQARARNAISRQSSR
jgi:hypothetical protein